MNENAPIRRAAPKDIYRLAEIEVFNYRLNFYPIFRNDDYYFSELRTDALARDYLERPEWLRQTFVYADPAVKGFIRVNGNQIEKLFVEPVLQGRGIGVQLLDHAVHLCGASCVWALEKNERALGFYARHGFAPTGERKPEEGTAEFLIRLERQAIQSAFSAFSNTSAND